MKKYIGHIITVLVLAGSAVFGYGQLTTKVTGNTDDLVKMEADVEEVQEFSVKQTILMERVINAVDKLEKRLYEQAESRNRLHPVSPAM